MGRKATPLTAWLQSASTEPFLMTCLPEQLYKRHRAIGAAAHQHRVYLRIRTILGHYLDKKESVAVIELTKATEKHPTRGRKCKST